MIVSRLISPSHVIKSTPFRSLAILLFVTVDTALPVRRGSARSPPWLTTAQKARLCLRSAFGEQCCASLALFDGDDNGRNQGKNLTLVTYGLGLLTSNTFMRYLSLSELLGRSGSV